MADLERGPVQSVSRALALLEELSSTGEVGLSELAERSGLSPSTVHRLLAALGSAGYVSRAPGGRYRIGARMEVISRSIAARSQGIVRTSRPHLYEIRDRFDETVNLVEMHGWNARYVDQVESLRPVRMFNRIGNEVPLHASAAGKAMAAAQPRRVRQAFLARAPFERITESTITEFEAMRSEFADIDSTGFAFDRQERDEGVVCVAAAVRDAIGGSSAALSMSGPADRMMSLDLSEVGRDLATAAAEISAELNQPS